ncbi:MAG: GMC family oxidoreductase N-terminal domain-containing protein [Aeromicrobium sp.]
MTYDYVIVGAGAAGCVLAHRLSADPSVEVLLVEDGGSARDPLLAVPRAFYFTLRSDRHVRTYPTEPSAGIPAESWPRGRGLGGSTAINGLMYVRGSAADFDALERRGNPGWGSADFLGAYRAIEDHALGGSATRGSGGPLGVSVPRHDDAVTDGVLSGAAAMGLRQVEDFNDSDDARIGFTPATIARGRRVSAATAFLGPARRRPNLTIATRTRAERLLWRDGAVVGVRLRRRGRVEEVAVRREVVVAAGAVESPLLLERSGIGRAEVLAVAGVEQRAESPHVGEGVIEQRAVSLQVRFSGRLGATERLNTLPRQAREAARYLATRRGPVATSGYDIVSAVRSTPEQERPDVQGVWVPMAIDETASHMRLAPYSGLLFTGYALRPTTASSVHIGSADPDAAPAIEARYLEDDAERATTASILGHARGLLAASPLADRIEDEVFPGPQVQSADDVIGYARAAGGGIYHAVGSCAMGPGDDDVVDADLRVRGVPGLRVVDASVLPQQVSGNTAAPVMALAWLAAGRILDDR